MPTTYTIKERNMIDESFIQQLTNEILPKIKRMTVIYDMTYEEVLARIKIALEENDLINLEAYKQVEQVTIQAVKHNRQHRPWLND